MKYITSKELAAKWHLTERTIRNYCASGKIRGCYLNGKTWMIPENANQITKSAVNDEGILSGLIDFLDNSTVNYLAVKNAVKILQKSGYKEINENSIIHANFGDKFYFLRNDSSLLAFNIANNLKDKSLSYHIIASHSDSPCFKIKPVCDSVSSSYNRVNVESYGGMICSTWLDRPLGVAGRVVYKDKDTIKSKIINIDEDVLMIPNLCIHFNRDINDGHKYDMSSDMQPFYACGLLNKPFTNFIGKRMNVKTDNILNFDLSVFNRQKATIWGEKSEFISSSRLDDLECVFTSLRAFVDAENTNSINVLYVCDNEEVGSSSRQGADSDFLDRLIYRVSSSLGYSNEEIDAGLANSFLISADNAHAVHPNFPNKTDADNAVYMNKGIAIKFNAAQRYTSDAISSSIFQEICSKAGVPFQFFANRSDTRGGSTLGNILINHVSLLSVDVGLPQLAMHSSYETAGSEDAIYAYKAFKQFYSCSIDMHDGSFVINYID